MSGEARAIQDAIRGAFTAFGDLAPVATYIAVTASSYDATTGAVTNTEKTYKGIPMVFARYKKREVDGDAILPEDQKVIIAALNLPVTPTVNDRIVMASGAIWKVMDKATDPATAVWVLQVRRP